MVNQFTGVVTLSSVLDYDVDRSYTLNIVAQVLCSSMTTHLATAIPVYI